MQRGKRADCFRTDKPVCAENVKYMLQWSPKSIKEIAMELDFPNLSFFGKYVKRYLGVSPKQYREQLSSDTSSKISD